MDLDAFEKQVRRLIVLQPRIEEMLADYEARKSANGEVEIEVMAPAERAPADTPPAPSAVADPATPPATDGPASETTAA